MTKKEKKTLLILGLLIGGAIILDQSKKKAARNRSPEGSISSLTENERYTAPTSGIWRPDYMTYINYPKY